jgi:hypothetical protein
MLLARGIFSLARADHEVASIHYMYFQLIVDSNSFLLFYGVHARIVRLLYI